MDSWLCAFHCIFSLACMTPAKIKEWFTSGTCTASETVEQWEKTGRAPLRIDVAGGVPMRLVTRRRTVNEFGRQMMTFYFKPKL